MNGTTYTEYLERLTASELAGLLVTESDVNRIRMVGQELYFRLLINDPREVNHGDDNFDPGHYLGP
jgi:hypothetical protein